MGIRLESLDPQCGPPDCAQNSAQLLQFRVKKYFGEELQYINYKVRIMFLIIYILNLRDYGV